MAGKYLLQVRALDAGGEVAHSGGEPLVDGRPEAGVGALGVDEHAVEVEQHAWGFLHHSLH